MQTHLGQLFHFRQFLFEDGLQRVFREMICGIGRVSTQKYHWACREAGCIVFCGVQFYVFLLAVLNLDDDVRTQAKLA